MTIKFSHSGVFNAKTCTLIPTIIVQKGNSNAIYLSFIWLWFCYEVAFYEPEPEDDKEQMARLREMVRKCNRKNEEV